MKLLSSTALLILLAAASSSDVLAKGKQAPAKKDPDFCVVPPGAQPLLPAKLLPGMGTTKNFDVTTTSEEARKFFLQGVSQIHSFWFTESERSCLQALEYDPKMAMAHWCIALSAASDFRPAFQLMRETPTGGPRGSGAIVSNEAAADATVTRTVNGAPVDPQTRAKEAIARAMALRDTVTPRERMYIEAQAARRAAGQKDAADAAYIAAMRKLVAAYPDDLDAATCARACRDVDLVLHQAALGSVPRSIESPLVTHAANATGFINMLVAARDAKVRRFVYAASSSTYGDHPGLPKVEDVIGRPLSPYAVTKYLNELYADVFARCYGMQTIGLRYFNVFGSRQDPEGPYAAVIPRWARAMLAGNACTINGDGQSSRDFTYVANAVQVNLRAALVARTDAVNQVYNVAVGERTTLNQLHQVLADALRVHHAALDIAPPVYAGFRAGDVRHSQADVGKAQRLLDYAPTHDVAAGMSEAVRWYITRFAPAAATARV